MLQDLAVDGLMLVRAKSQNGCAQGAGHADASPRRRAHGHSCVHGCGSNETSQLYSSHYRLQHYKRVRRFEVEWVEASRVGDRPHGVMEDIQFRRRDPDRKNRVYT